MSRIIVKNLPKKISEDRLRGIFAEHGNITQVKHFPKRRFAYVGYLKESDANAASRYLDDTYIDTSKIEVKLALGMGDKRLPRPWSKYSKGSSRHNEYEAQKADDEAKKEKARQAAILKNKKDVSQRLQDEKAVLESVYQVEANPAVNPELHEFLQVMMPQSKKRTWANEGMTDGSNETVKSNAAKRAVAKAQMEAVPNRRAGGEGQQLVRTKIKFQDSDAESEDEYQDLSHQQTVAAGKGTGPGSEESDEESGSDSDDKAAGVSDIDWLKSKMRQEKDAAGAEDEDEEEGDGSDDESQTERDATDSQHNMDVTSDHSHSDEEDSGDDGDGSYGHDSSMNPTPSNSFASGSAARQVFTVKLHGLPYTADEEKIKDFFAPLQPADIRVIMNKDHKPTGIAFVDFATARAAKNALKRDKAMMGPRYVEVAAAKGQDTVSKEKAAKQAQRDAERERRRKKYPTLEDGDETLAESGRIFVRNLTYACTEDDLRKLFEPFGALSDVYIPLDKDTKKSKAIGFVTFVMPEHAVRAFEQLDGIPFQGRLLHLLPAKNKDNNNTGMEVTEPGNYKHKKLAEQKAKSGSSFNWNTLFLRQDTVADVMASDLGVSKGELLDKDAGASLAVRMAMGETQIVAENKKFLKDHGVVLSAFDTRVEGRSRTVILVKNLPYSVSQDELRALFSKHGNVIRLVMPPSNTIALVEFAEPSEARAAFRGLAYRRLKNEPIYLEWAPKGCFASDDSSETAGGPHAAASEPSPAVQQTKEAQPAAAESKTAVKAVVEDDADADVDDTPSTSVFVKNINFETTEDSLRDLFQPIGVLRAVRIATKKDPKDKSKLLSMGFGFVEFKSRKDAIKAMKQLQGTELDGHELELKLSTKTGSANTGAVEVQRGKVPTGNKLIVRNLAFEATKHEINELFSAYGQIKSVRLPKKKVDGSHRGFAFVEFLSKEDAKNAFEALSGSTHLYGRRLVLEFAKDENSLEEARARTARAFSKSGPSSKRRKVDL